MTGYQFIFSNERKHRIARHLVFWGIYYLRFVLLGLPDIKLTTLADTDVYLNALFNALYFLPVYLFAVYVTVYFILPKYLSKRNTLFLILSVLLLIAVSNLSVYFTLMEILKKAGDQWNNYDVLTVLYKFTSNFISVACAAVIFKVMKDFSLKQRVNEMLAVDNARNKLQLMKMKIHPRILFECLQSIYNDIDEGTQHAPAMILKLSDLLSYLLYEAQSKQVRLTEEIQMVRNYLELKRMEYKNKISIDFEIGGNTDGYYLTPALFLPLLEIGIVPFDKLDTILTVTIEIKTVESTICFNLKNNIPGIQIINTPVAQRAWDSTKTELQMSHPKRSKLEFQPAANSFSIMLQLEQGKFNVTSKDNIQNSGSLLYEHA